jgi:hypothetical protein
MLLCRADPKSADQYNCNDTTSDLIAQRLPSQVTASRGGAYQLRAARNRDAFLPARENTCHHCNVILREGRPAVRAIR